MTPDEIAEALADVARRKHQLRQLEVEYIGQARGRGATWQEIAAALHLDTPQAAQQRWQRRQK